MEVRHTRHRHSLRMCRVLIGVLLGLLAGGIVILLSYWLSHR